MCVQKLLKSGVWIDETYSNSVQEGSVRAVQESPCFSCVREGWMDINYGNLLLLNRGIIPSLQ